MDPITLILINAGVSAFNSWRNSKQAKKLQQKQQEFALAAAERNRQRMWDSMREGQSLTMEIEQENHDARLKEITDEFDNILKRLAYAEAIKVWPLKVLPIVMKNQSLGNLMASKDENIAMHCILTPSNCENFNSEIFPIIEQQVSDFCNTHWNTLSSHPVLFYSGAWKSNFAPTGIEIEQLKTDLRSLPTLMITPFFKPEGGLVFNINVWGVGIELNAAEILCNEFSYSDCYEKGLNYKGDDDLTKNTIEEFVPYLQCLIGYFADQYFWTAHNEAPILPSLLEMNVVNTDGKLFLREASKERYGLLLDVGKKESAEMPFAPEKMLTLLEGSATLWDEQTRKKKLEEILVLFYSQEEYDVNLESILKKHPWLYDDKKILRKIESICINDTDVSMITNDIIEEIDSNVYCYVEECDTLYFKDVLDWCNEQIETYSNEIHYVSIKVMERQVVVAMLDYTKAMINYKDSPMCIVYKFEQFIVPDFVEIRNDKIILDKFKFKSVYNQILLK